MGSITSLYTGSLSSKVAYFIASFRGQNLGALEF
jgi:hypothetical protein